MHNIYCDFNEKGAVNHAFPARWKILKCSKYNLFYLKKVHINFQINWLKNGDNIKHARGAHFLGHPIVISLEGTSKFPD